MVKQFIKGLIKKKEEKDELKKEDIESEDVPDELPALAEDVVKKEETDKKPEEKEVPQKKSEVPEELPNIPEKQEQDVGVEKEQQPFKDLDEKHKEEIPAEIEKSKEKSIESFKKEEKTKEEGNEQEESKEEKQEVKKLSKENEISKGELPKSFFSNILRHINQDGVIKEKLLSGDLFSRMSNYWELKKDEIRTGSSLSNEQKLEQDLIKELMELENLENKWQVQKLALEEDLKFLHEREKDIQLKLEELKRITNELKLYKNVSPEEYFYLHNGVVIKNLHELIDALEVMDEETFKHHVNDNRNDFSNWVKEVIKDINIAEKLNKAKTKNEMIKILETEPIREQEEEQKLTKKNIKPEDYFWLANGVVIKDLYELSDALKVMDDKVFRQHVKEGKNDFSNWIRKVMNNKYLADKLAKVKSKQEMINLLEVFL
jgi:hypothetical protein